MMKRVISLLLLLMLTALPALSLAGVSYEALRQKYSKAFAMRSVDDELVFGEGDNMQWKKVGGNKLSIRVKLQNGCSDCGRTVKAVELWAYPVNVWGERVLGGNRHYYWTTKKEIKPGVSVWTDYCTMDDCDEIDRIYCGIRRIAYTDGTTETFEDVDYLNWTVTFE